VAEAGVPGYEHTGWFGIMAPAGTPKEIIDKLNAEIRAMVARPDVKAYWEKQGTETMSLTPAQSEDFLRAELEKWTKVVKAANIKLE
jgi:tripartite-type tricarboxylate transporter receptor subunit TctC